MTEAPPFKTVFPADDQLAVFAMSMAMAGNDIEQALRQAVKANADDRPEFGYWVRVANGFTFEAIRALGAWREVPEIAHFLRGLPARGREKLKVVSGIEQRLGVGTLAEVRHQTFHYPCPGPHEPDSATRLSGVLAQHADGPVEMDQLHDGNIRFTFADGIALMLALGSHLPPDDPGFIEQAENARDAAIAFASLAKDIINAYFKKRGIAVEIQGDEFARTTGT